MIFQVYPVAIFVGRSDNFFFEVIRTTLQGWRREHSGPKIGMTTKRGQM